MNLVPSNQTLILASERDPIGGTAATALAPARRERVTILASRPNDTLLYLQADYSKALAPLARSLPARISPQASQGSTYRTRRNIQSYASTQSNLAEAQVAHLDVYA